jgi:oligopeptide/dipeptide ABC transporter ATP-binding protein
VPDPLLSIRDLTKIYRVRRSIGRVEHVRGIDRVSFDVHPSTTVGIVGESGSGKSTVGRCVLGLTAPTSGEVHLDGERIDQLGVTRLRPYRRRMQMVFQMPQRSFDPLMTIRASVEEPLRRLRPDLASSERRARGATVLDAVRLGKDLWDRRPAALSGGQLQRAAIARALAPEPELVFLDEPTSALDMSVRGEILTLLRDLRARLDVAFVFVSHDLEAVRSVADEVIVMYLGQIVERGRASEVFSRPLHPYTRALLAAGRFSDAGPVLGARSGRDPLEGCRLAPRCPYAEQRCQEDQVLRDLGGDQSARCWKAEQLVPG